MTLPYEITRYQELFWDISSLETDADGFRELLEAVLQSFLNWKSLLYGCFSHRIRRTSLRPPSVWASPTTMPMRRVFSCCSGLPDAHIPGYATHFLSVPVVWLLMTAAAFW